MISVLRMSLGDFDFTASMFLNEQENSLFWVMWVLIVFVTNIIFLNFIIAETSASYEKVSQRLSAVVTKERVSLIIEAESMRFE